MTEWHIRARLHEGLLNSIFDAVSQQRPALLNYATPALAKGAKTCSPVDSPPNGAPAYTIIEPLVMGQTKRIRLVADYCYQFSDLAMDFSPTATGGIEHFRLTANIEVGLGVPDTLILEDMLLPGEGSGPVHDNLVDYTTLKCFRGTMETAGVARFIKHRTKPMLIFQVTTFSLGGGDGLLGFVEPYIRTMINAAILPKTAFTLDPLTIAAPDQKAPKIKVVLEPAPLPANPDFAEDRLMLSINTN